MKVGNDLKIGVNALALSDKNTGIGNYTIQIINHLAKQYNDEIIVYSSNEKKIEKHFDSAIEIVTISIADKGKLFRLFAEQIILPRQTKKDGIDILFSPSFTIPLFSSAFNVVTVHDLAYKVYPKASALYARIYMNIFFDRSIKKADAVISVSNSTSRDINKYFPSREDIFTSYEGIKSFDSKKGMKSKKFNGIKSYALVVGTITPRKNILGIIKAFENIMHETSMKLVFVGGYSWKTNEIFEYVKTNKLEDRVNFFGYLSVDELYWAYCNAKMLIYCSFYEGFGFPPLEAMQVGVPVIASNTSSIPEICGNAALYVNPYNIKEICSAILYLEGNKEKRKELVKKGYERIKMFTWEKAARKTHELFEKVVGEI